MRSKLAALEEFLEEKDSHIRKKIAIKLIIRLKERRPPPTERNTEYHQENNRSDHTGWRGAGGSNKGQPSANQRDSPNDFGRNGNLPPCRQNRNFPPLLQNRK
jgi:hypothetical protein